VVDGREHAAATARPAMRGYLPVAGSGAALPGDREGKALLITRHLTVKAAHPVITVSVAAGGRGQPGRMGKRTSRRYTLAIPRERWTI
jgi:hypothetical protein